ncbi:hypothetical protein EDB95_5125 [Dinghuibacter silviterrae]|uniref:Endosialidase-like protein n=2 Tax=Dinghuibacter silviterrae TaxID=1539049 RepID=A0A4R8DIF4_9BACT|nr:hypothetical protein EDB95_5125 [Dinghuibacter silviterrae]
MKQVFLLACLLLVHQFLFAQWSTNGNNIYNSNTGLVGIGTNSPSRQLTVTSGTGIGPLLVQGPAGYLLIDNQGTGSSYYQANTLHQFQGASNNPIMTLLSNGNVGIGNVLPGYPLDVNGSVAAGGANVSSNTTKFYIRNGSGKTWAFSAGENSVNETNFGLYDWSDNQTTPYLTVTSQGNVLIGKSSQVNSSYILDVAGTIRANQVAVNTTGADFVFDTSYVLPSLSTVRDYVSQNHHLPGIPSAKAMQTEGIKLGESQTQLLQKVEELTLYAIEADKRVSKDEELIGQQQALLLALQAQLKAQQAEIDRLKAKP